MLRLASNHEATLPAFRYPRHIAIMQPFFAAAPSRQSFLHRRVSPRRWPSSRLEEQTEFSLVAVYVTVTLSMNCASSALCLSYKRAPKVAGSVSTNCGSFWLTSRTADPKQHLLKQPPASAKSPRNLESRRQGNDLNVPRGSDKACI